MCRIRTEFESTVDIDDGELSESSFSGRSAKR